MRINRYFLSLMFMAVCTSCVGNNSLEVKVKVIDQNGLSVEGANVQVGFQPLGFGGSSEEGVTNKDGIYVVTGESNLQYWVLVTKDGYYESRLDQQEVKEQVAPGEWKIVDQDATLTLREMKNPVPMYAKAITALNIPKKGEDIGFDLEKGDWVAPHGNGETVDLLVFADGIYNSSKDNDSRLRLTFPNSNDGFIIEDIVVEESDFISPYIAPLSGYQIEFKGRKATVKSETGRPYRVNELQNHDVILFRIRTILDDNGEVQEARYGKIYNGFKLGGAASEKYWISFNYYLNPEVNDRNLEYAVGKSLIKNIDKSEQPKKP